jgi:hypothetical protein
LFPPSLWKCRITQGEAIQVAERLDSMFVNQGLHACHASSQDIWILRVGKGPLSSSPPRRCRRAAGRSSGDRFIVFVSHQRKLVPREGTWRRAAPVPLGPEIHLSAAVSRNTCRPTPPPASRAGAPRPCRR